jgi:hypothetical protein
MAADLLVDLPKQGHFKGGVQHDHSTGIKGDCHANWPYQFYETGSFPKPLIGPLSDTTKTCESQGKAKKDHDHAYQIYAKPTFPR